MEILGGLGIGFIIWYGGYRVIEGTSTPGTFFSFMAAVLMLYEPVKKVSKLNNNIQEGLAAADRVFDIIERESDIKERENPIAIQRGSHSVSFEHVWFGYDESMVLEDINIHAEPGEIIALAGMSGGGKDLPGQPHSPILRCDPWKYLFRRRRYTRPFHRLFAAADRDRDPGADPFQRHHPR